MSQPTDPGANLAAAIAARVPDADRLRAVRATGLLDTPADEPFDRLARLASTVLEAPFAFVTVVDDRRSFWKACIGVDATDPADRQNLVQESFCQYVIGMDAELIVGDTANDPRTSENPSIESMGVAAWAGFPLRAPDGEALGTFCVVDTRVRDWTPRDVEVLRTLADAAGGEVALRAAAEQSAELARTLQSTLLPPVAPRAPGLDIGAAFRPAGSGTEVMGDFYDVFESGHGRWNLVLGDVCGKGIEAARMTGLARYTLRGGAMHDSTPSRVLTRLDEAIKLDASFDDRFVTATLVTLDGTRDGFEASLSSGGHPPAIVRDRRGCRLVDAPGSVLGIVEPLTLTDRLFHLAPGDLILLYTDGVTDARAQDGTRFETDRLVALVAGADGDAQALADTILRAVEAFADGPLEDDVAVLIARVPTAG